MINETDPKYEKVVESLTDEITKLSPRKRRKNEPPAADENVDTSPPEPTKYVVVRDNRRVSDKEYDMASDPSALAEKTFWQSVVKRYPDGSKVTIVKYNKKLHRIW